MRSLLCRAEVESADPPTPLSVSLDGALGKIALRTRSAPRQLLQVSSTTPSSHHALLAGLNTAGESAPSSADDANAQKPPLAHRAILSIVEQIYDAVLDLEQMRRSQPALLAQVAAAKEYGPEGSPMIEKADQDVAEWFASFPAFFDCTFLTSISGT